MTPEQLEQAARIVCKKRGWDTLRNPTTLKPLRLQSVMQEITTFMQLAEACDEVLSSEVTV